MAFDGLFIHSLLIKLNDNLVGGHLTKISNPSEDTLIFSIRNNGKTHNLLLTINSQFPHFRLTDKIPQNPLTASNTLMTYRRYLQNGRLLSIKQQGADRIIYFEIENKNELGDKVFYRVVLEIIGSKTNLLLLTSGDKIIDAFKKNSLDDQRPSLPGLTYTPFTTTKKNPFINGDSLTFETVNDFQGFGKETRQYIQFYDTKKFIEAFNHPEPTLKVENDSFAAWNYFGNTSTRNFKSLSSLLDFIVDKKINSQNTSKLANQLNKVVTSLIKKNENKILNLNKDIDQSKNAGKYKQFGDILTTYLNQIPNNADAVDLPNFYDDMKNVSIPLDVTLSPNANAQKYFKKYSKLKNSIMHIEQQLRKTTDEIMYLKELEYQLSVAQNNDLVQINQELLDNKYIKNKQQRSKRKASVKSTPEQFHSTDGDLIEVGKNNIQNENLSIKNANKDDIWLHVKDIPGSHVIIRNPNPSEQTIEQAAVLAAYFSKAKNSSKVPVDYLPAGKLKKTSGSKPGFVTFKGQTTILVNPDFEVVESLRG